jgi:hypothetical protein
MGAIWDEHTFCENKRVLFDKVIEGVGLELMDI